MLSLLVGEEGYGPLVPEHTGTRDITCWDNAEAFELSITVSVTLRFVSLLTGL